MSDIVRLTFVSHGITDATSAGRFPIDEPLSARGQRQFDATVELGSVDTAYCGPEKRARQTSELLGLRAETVDALADLDCGSWRGSALTAVPPADLALWLTDASAAPHGGESVVDVIGRVRRWMDALASQRGRVVAVTHRSVIRAAVLLVLDAPPKSFWRVDIAPASRTVLHLRGHAWTLRSTG